MQSSLGYSGFEKNVVISRSFTHAYKDNLEQNFDTYEYKLCERYM